MSMNCAVYVFGKLGNGYVQYPDDYAKKIFRNFHAKSAAASQITIHRNNSLMYYGYVRRLDTDGQYIGFCILLNGVMFSRIGGLFSVFENAVADLISGGKIIGFSDNGDIVAKTDDLNSGVSGQEVERIVSAIRQAASALEGDVKRLPPVSYGIANDESMRFSVSDKVEDIVEATGKYGYTCVFKDSDFDTVATASYRDIIKGLYSEKERIAREYEVLESEYIILRKQKKQYKKVVISYIVFFVSIIGVLFSVKYLFEANWRIGELEHTLYDEVSPHMPMVIKDVEIHTDYGGEEDGCIYSDMSLRPIITYEGLVPWDIILTVKLYTPAGDEAGNFMNYLHECYPDGYTYEYPFTIMEGANVEDSNIWLREIGEDWDKGTYRIEFWYGDVCLKAKSFTIEPASAGDRPIRELILGDTLILGNRLILGDSTAVVIEGDTVVFPDFVRGEVL